LHCRAIAKKTIFTSLPLQKNVHDAVIRQFGSRQGYLSSYSRMRAQSIPVPRRLGYALGNDHDVNSYLQPVKTGAA
jgi:hypothetical protein